MNLKISSHRDCSAMNQYPITKYVRCEIFLTVSISIKRWCSGENASIRPHIRHQTCNSVLIWHQEVINAIKTHGKQLMAASILKKNFACAFVSPITQDFTFLKLISAQQPSSLIIVTCTFATWADTLSLIPIRITCKYLSLTRYWSLNAHKNFLVSPGRGHLNVTWREGAKFSRISTTCLGKSFAFQYPVSEFLDNKTIAKTIAYCSSTDNHNLLRNFWSICIPCSGI